MMEDIESVFEKAVPLFFLNSDENNEFLYKKLLEENIGEELAMDILVFLPICLNRIIFEKHELKFPDLYFMYNSEGALIEEKRYSDNGVYRSLSSYLKKVVDGGLTEKELLSILHRSSEFNALNNAMKGGANLASLKIEPMKIYW